MELVLYRHGIPRLSGKNKLLGSDFSDWLEKYRIIDIEPIIWEKEKYPIVYSSTLERSISTATQIGKEIIEKEEICEAELPKLRFPKVRLRVKCWLVIARILWIFGCTNGCESQRKFKERVSGVADWLESISHYERLCLVGHGWFNRSLTKELKRRNWMLKESTGKGFLSYQILTDKN